MKLKPDKLHSFARKAAHTALGVVAACSLAVASLFATADEVFPGNAIDPPAVIVSYDEDRLAATKKRASPTAAERLRVRLRGLFLRQSAFVRGAVVLPLWCVGKALLSLASLLFTALSPVLQILLGLLLNAALLFGLFILIFKLLFPNKRLKELLTRKNILLLIGGAVFLTVADAALRHFWDAYAPISIAIKLVCALAVLALVCRRLFGKRKARVSA